jgi:hypothetical protein
MRVCCAPESGCVSGQTSAVYLELAEDLQNILDQREDYEMCICG